METSSALTEITERGVDTAQGFLFSPGLPQAAFLTFIANARRGVGPAQTTRPSA